MVEATLKVCRELCEGMLNDYREEIDQAIMKLPDEGGELSISMNFKIKPDGAFTNDVAGSISFAKEKIRDKRSRTAYEAQMEIQFEREDTKQLPAGESENGDVIDADYDEPQTDGKTAAAGGE